MALDDERLQFDEVAVAANDSVADTVGRLVLKTLQQDGRLKPEACLKRHQGLVVQRATAATVDIDADYLILEDPTDNGLRYLSSVNETVNITVAGAGGLDTGSEAGSTWYFVFVIYNNTTLDTNCLLSLSDTSPTLPSGYDFFIRVGAVYNDSGNNFIDFYQDENNVEYSVLQTIKDGSFTINAWTAQSLSPFFPTTSKRIIVAGAGTNQMGISPRSDGHAGAYFRTDSTSSSANNFGGIFPSTRFSWGMLEIRYVSSIYYFTTNANSSLIAVGWRESVL
jgi:hypothetical protein